MNMTLSKENKNSNKSIYIAYTLYNIDKLEHGTIKTIDELKNFLNLEGTINVWIDFLGGFGQRDAS